MSRDLVRDCLALVSLVVSVGLAGWGLWILGPGAWCLAGGVSLFVGTLAVYRREPRPRAAPDDGAMEVSVRPPEQMPRPPIG